ncbi:tyrosine-type recombinase/integrase [Clostridium sp. LP20]|uniref:tyrosine-type recombinase/integrase n=1 Tax=Clostridium sp. LP20 TaxID=3418665 RepID=UPI003EE4AC30
MEYNITYRQKDKGWQFIISYKVNSKWKQKAKQGFKTKKEAKPIAEKEVLKLKELINNESLIINDKYNTILFSTLYELFINHMKLYRENNTIDSYKFSYAKFKELHNMKVADIKKIHIQKSVDALIGEGIKASSIETYTKKIKQLFVYYKDNYDPSYIIPTNEMIMPRPSKTTKNALTLEETDKMLKELKGSKFYIVILLCVKCGLRRGEALGVTWSDLDEVNMTLTINKQWKKISSELWGFGSTKNKKTRIVPISSSTLKELKEYKSKAVTDINNRIFTHTGLYVSQVVNKELKKYGVTLHELRHTFTTNLIANGVDFKTAAELIGDTVEMVLKTYSHVNDDMMKNAQRVISSIF